MKIKTGTRIASFVILIVYLLSTTAFAVERDDNSLSSFIEGLGLSLNSGEKVYLCFDSQQSRSASPCATKIIIESQNSDLSTSLKEITLLSDDGGDINISPITLETISEKNS